MIESLAQLEMPPLVQSAMAAGSAAMTSYFWLVKARRERPDLKIYQLANFRATLRRGDPERPGKRLGLMQIQPGGVLMANNSVRQNSVVRFDCYLEHEGRKLKGDWGWSHDDKPPWNVGPETTIAVSPACFFDVPEDYEVPDDLRFGIEFVTISGRRFGHQFSLNAPPL